MEENKQTEIVNDPFLHSVDMLTEKDIVVNMSARKKKISLRF